jgi:hypothetical protein
MKGFLERVMGKGEVRPLSRDPYAMPEPEAKVAVAEAPVVLPKPEPVADTKSAVPVQIATKRMPERLVARTTPVPVVGSENQVTTAARKLKLATMKEDVKAGARSLMGDTPRTTEEVPAAYQESAPATAVPTPAITEFTSVPVVEDVYMHKTEAEVIHELEPGRWATMLRAGVERLRTLDRNTKVYTATALCAAMTGCAQENSTAISGKIRGELKAPEVTMPRIVQPTPENLKLRTFNPTMEASYDHMEIRGLQALGQKIQKEIQANEERMKAEKVSDSIHSTEKTRAKIVLLQEQINELRDKGSAVAAAYHKKRTI